MLLLTALGAVLVLTAVGRTWAEGVAPGMGGSRIAVQASGSKLTQLPTGMALVAMAAAVAVFAVRGRTRVLVGALTVLAGVGAVVGAVIGYTDTAGLHAVAAGRLALSSGRAEEITRTAWPWVALAGGVLLVAAGVLTARFGSGWPAMGSRYEAPTRKAATGKAAGPADLWKALDRGEDPTG
ncbi:TIGR02234 family membrane protein [Kitasatospora cineracea]|uniref:Membrane protein (TIGR02234 family) n=1 Tax=Kitasatospora cineracea TaxID=88074 RepID=A0A3N4RW66_9ACTN|nr:TIGR02234 family membrane protein [Kitasatospora cineracea]ROR44936.1 putative membrane protein (TIGR02234 family) [Kitasatospora cineracea]RPE35301.1 putative membrane protein (TIGR02234 family) [Kitasatospora cineracea]